MNVYVINGRFGVYVQLGETIGFVRWLRFEIDVGLGVRGRDERGLELAARQVNAPGEHLPEEPAEEARVGPLGFLVVVNGPGIEE